MQSKYVSSKQFVLGLGLLILGAPQAKAAPSAAIPNLMDVFSKAMMSSSSLSKTKLAGLRIVVGAEHSGGEAESLRVNFDDNRLDLLTESLIFSNGKYGEFDSSSGVSLEPVSQGSFCTMKAKRGPLETGPLTESQIQSLPRDWVFPEGGVWKVDPYTPAAMRAQDLGDEIVLRLEIVPPSESVARKEVRIDEIFCQIHLKDLENAEAGLKTALDETLGPWLNFAVKSP